MDFVTKPQAMGFAQREDYFRHGASATARRFRASQTIFATRKQSAEEDYSPPSTDGTIIIGT